MYLSTSLYIFISPYSIRYICLFLFFSVHMSFACESLIHRTSMFFCLSIITYLLSSHSFISVLLWASRFVKSLLLSVYTGLSHLYFFLLVSFFLIFHINLSIAFRPIFYSSLFLIFQSSLITLYSLSLSLYLSLSLTLFTHFFFNSPAGRTKLRGRYSF